MIKIKQLKTVEYPDFSPEAKEYISYIYDTFFGQDKYVEDTLGESETILRKDAPKDAELVTPEEEWADDYVYVKGSNSFVDEMLDAGFKLGEKFLLLIWW